MSKKWRVGILGLGHWYSAYNIARAMPGYPKAELAAVAWHDPAQLAEFSSTFGVQGYRDYAQLLAREDIDIVHIAAPVVEIPELTRLAAKAGKHILLGKPMAMTVAQADEMVQVVEAAGVTCFPFQGILRLRFADVKARIDRGDIGDIAVIHQTCRWSIAEDWPDSGMPGWFADPAKVPGGAFIDEGIYWIDYFRFLTGSEVVRVDAKMANLVHKDLGVEDWGMATFTFANGMIATLEAAWTINAPQKSGPSPKQNSVVRLEVVGTRGEIAHQYFRDPGRSILAAGARDWVFERHAPSLFAADRAVSPCRPHRRPGNHGLPVATIEDARRSFVIAMAAYQSAPRGSAGEAV